MKTNNRPLSPHLQVYRPQLTSLLSITHRATGMFMAVSIPVLVYWFWALASGEDTYSSSQRFFGSWFGRTILFMWSYALFYHLCNGIRHMVWDMGLGLEIPTLYKSGWFMVVTSIGLTIFLWVVGYAARGGI